MKKAPKKRGKNVVARMGDDQLREFVMQWCDGWVTSSNEVPGHIMHCVFMPLALGALDGWTKAQLKQVGLVYGVRGRDRTTNMGVNGFPIFFSCAFLHVEDWERARTAINAELERRKNVRV